MTAGGIGPEAAGSVAGGYAEGGPLRWGLPAP